MREEKFNKKKRPKKKSHLYSGQFLAKSANFRKKYFFKIFYELFADLPFFDPLYKWKAKFKRAEQSLILNRKVVTKLEIPNPDTLAHKDLHILVSEAISTAKKVYVHYTPKGVLVVKILF